MFRVTPPRPDTPPAAPLVFREAPPPKPKPLPTKIIHIPGRVLPPPPRKVIVERKPSLPAKPQDILIERWLAYKQPVRNVRYEQEPNIVPLPAPKNEIIQWDTPELIVKKNFAFLGVEKADPSSYEERYHDQLVLAGQLPREAEFFKAPPGEKIAADARHADPPILAGDVQALGLIDLDKENLAEYREIVRKQFGHENVIREVYSRLYNRRYEGLYKGLYSDLSENNAFKREPPLQSMQKSQQAMPKMSPDRAFDKLKKSFDQNNIVKFQSNQAVHRQQQKLQPQYHNHVSNNNKFSSAQIPMWRPTNVVNINTDNSFLSGHKLDMIDFSKY